MCRIPAILHLAISPLGRFPRRLLMNDKGQVKIPDATALLLRRRRISGGVRSIHCFTTTFLFNCLYFRQTGQQYRFGICPRATALAAKIMRFVAGYAIIITRSIGGRRLVGAVLIKGRVAGREFNRQRRWRWHLNRQRRGRGRRNGHRRAGGGARIPVEIRMYRRRDRTRFTALPTPVWGGPIASNFLARHNR